MKDHKMHLGDWVRKISFAAVAIICSFALDPGCYARSAEREAAARELFRDFRPYNTERIRGLTEQQRSLMLDVLSDNFGKEREQIKGGRPGSIYVTVIFEMALLGDDQALKEYCDYFLAFKSRSNPVNMLILCSPKAIPLIGEALFKEEQYEVPGDVGLLPTQNTVANIILDTVSKAPEFSKDAANWAGRALSAPMGVDIKQLRFWYRENETKLKTWDFKAVQPGAEPPELRNTSSVDSQPKLPPLTAVFSASTPSSHGTREVPVGIWSRRHLVIIFMLVTVCSLVWLIVRKRK